MQIHVFMNQELAGIVDNNHHQCDENNARALDFFSGYVVPGVWLFFYGNFYLRSSSISTGAAPSMLDLNSMATACVSALMNVLCSWMASRSPSGELCSHLNRNFVQHFKTHVFTQVLNAVHQIANNAFAFNSSLTVISKDAVTPPSVYFSQPGMSSDEIKTSSIEVELSLRRSVPAFSRALIMPVAWTATTSLHLLAHIVLPRRASWNFTCLTNRPLAHHQCIQNGLCVSLRFLMMDSVCLNHVQPNLSVQSWQ